MKLLYIAQKYDHGRPESGYGFEHCNFFDSLSRMGLEIVYFDHRAIFDALGGEGMSARLLEVARREKPDVLFYVPIEEKYDPLHDMLNEITRNTGVTTIAWFSDDHFRFDNHTRLLAPCFDFSVTTDEASVPKYKAIGYEASRVILSQWACNHFLYGRKNVPLAHDVTFIGQAFPHRRAAIAALAAAGVAVETWGNLWGEGRRINQVQMIDVFNSSRINLNLAASGHFKEYVPPVMTLERRVKQAIGRVPGVRAAREMLRQRNEAALARNAAAAQTSAPVRTALAPAIFPRQIKGRNFEVPGCGGFLLTEQAPRLEKYYVPGREIICFESVEELAEKIRWYLGHENERLAVAQAGYERTLREHTYVHRFTDIFQRTGVWRDHVVDFRERSGQIKEITMEATGRVAITV